MELSEIKQEINNNNNSMSDDLSDSFIQPNKIKKTQRSVR